MLPTIAGRALRGKDGLPTTTGIVVPTMSRLRGFEPAEEEELEECVGGGGARKDMPGASKVEEVFVDSYGGGAEGTPP